MNELGERMVDGGTKPNDRSVANWIGPKNQKYWTHMVHFIDSNYPGTFQPDWWFGGKKFGWALRYKKSKSFCNFIPEKDRFRLLLVFGRDEREKVEAELSKLISHARADYTAAPTFHDGKWLSLAVDGEDVLTDIERLLKIKRKLRQTVRQTEASRPAQGEMRPSSAAGARPKPLD
jgi:hypothetical protein